MLEEEEEDEEEEPLQPMAIEVLDEPPPPPEAPPPPVVQRCAHAIHKKRASHEMVEQSSGEYEWFVWIHDSVICPYRIRAARARPSEGPPLVSEGPLWGHLVSQTLLSGGKWPSLHQDPISLQGDQ